MKKAGKYVEHALREAYSLVNYNLQLDNREIEIVTNSIRKFKQELSEAQARRSEAMDEKLELRNAMWDLGIDPDEEVTDEA